MRISDVLAVCDALTDDMHYAANSILYKPNGRHTQYLSPLRTKGDNIVNTNTGDIVGRLSEGYTYRNRL